MDRFISTTPTHKNRREERRHPAPYVVEDQATGAVVLRTHHKPKADRFAELMSRGAAATADGLPKARAAEPVSCRLRLVAELERGVEAEGGVKKVRGDAKKTEKAIAEGIAAGRKAK